MIYCEITHHNFKEVDPNQTLDIRFCVEEWLMAWENIHDLRLDSVIDEWLIEIHIHLNEKKSFWSDYLKTIWFKNDADCIVVLLYEEWKRLSLGDIKAPFEKVWFLRYIMKTARNHWKIVNGGIISLSHMHIHSQSPTYFSFRAKSNTYGFVCL